MSSISRNLLLRLQVKRGLLLRHYDDEALHQLRVTLRRLRALLKQDAGSEQTDRLRHELGELADATNAARDWDTLLCRARESLRPRDFRQVQPWLRENRLASHPPVLDMLRSSEWSDAVGMLDAFIAGNRQASASDRQHDEQIAGAKHGVQSAWEKVQLEDDRKHWHKLRIAIKDLRYTLDSLPRAVQKPPSKTLKHCKRLQDALGAWHDTAVHLQMVREFASGLDPAVEPELHKILNTWCRRMESEAQGAIDEAKSFLQGKGSGLLRW